jgi:hypothetical protein
VGYWADGAVTDLNPQVWIRIPGGGWQGRWRRFAHPIAPHRPNVARTVVTGSIRPGWDRVSRWIVVRLVYAVATETQRPKWSTDRSKETLHFVEGPQSVDVHTCLPMLEGAYEQGVSLAATAAESSSP